MIRLFPKRLECVCCHETATPLHRKAGEPVMLSIALTVTRKGAGKRRTRAAGSVRICETCLIRANAGDPMEGIELLGAALDKLGRCYSSLLDDEPDAADLTEQPEAPCLL